MGIVDGHAGDQAIEALARFGVDTIFTLNGGHIWPFYEAAMSRSVRLVDTRHEQTATFAAEALAKLTRRPGVAALTAGPGITNGVSAITSAHFNGSPLIVLGGRAPSGRWGAGSLQELDHVPIVASITKSAATVTDPASAGTMVHQAAALALTPQRGPVFLDFPLDVFGPTQGEVPDEAELSAGPEPDADTVRQLGALVAAAERPVFVVGSDVYWSGAEAELLGLVEQSEVPCLFNGMGRGMIPADHPLAFLRTRGVVKQRADLVVVMGTPLDFRLGFGRFGGARVVHMIEDPEGRAGHVDVLTVAGRLPVTLRMLTDRAGTADAGARRSWVSELRQAEDVAAASDAELLGAEAEPVRPSRIYGELRQRLARDAVVICDGGDFASYAGKFIEVYQPGCWLDTGPYGCLGNGLGYAIAARVARPSSQVVLLLGDGAAGFSLMDVDTLVRHGLPVVMIVGNNGIWGLEKHPMQAIYGWDVACDLAPGTRYDEVVRALGGAGETVKDPAEIGPALDRAFAADCPYLVNVLTDPADMYPRTSSLA
jgi:acetolactate synthase-1/2/3 large subunit